jgi:hypothetical protein
MKTFNEPYSKLSMKRRYEVWFLRLAMNDGSGAWWFRYLLMNPGRSGCPGDVGGRPVQVWATWFPRAGKPETWIQGFGLEDFRLRRQKDGGHFFETGENWIGQNECRGRMEMNGHRIGWDLRYQSTFRMELSSKGWIGFSRTPHSDASFSGEITLDARTFRGEPLGLGMQGHNCGYKHRGFWTWAHLHFASAGANRSTFEALCYDMPMGLVFRRGVLWHKGQKYVFGKLRESLRDPGRLAWNLEGEGSRGGRFEAEIAGREGFVHRLPYTKTDCSGTFEVANDSLASGRVILRLPGQSSEELTTDTGAVLEMAGEH